MSKPDDIPQDVWDAASAKASEYIEWLKYIGWLDAAPEAVADSKLILTTTTLARAIMLATVTERKRCAAIARNAHAAPPPMRLDRGDIYMYAVSHGAEIAAQIEAGA